MAILSPYDSVSLPLSRRNTAFAVVLAEQVPEQRQMTGTSVMLVRHGSVTGEPSSTDVLYGTTSNVVSVGVKQETTAISSTPVCIVCSCIRLKHAETDNDNHELENMKGKKEAEYV